MKKKTMPGLIGVQEAADYLGCSNAYLGQILNGEDDHPIKEYFRHYAGRWRTTYGLLDEWFTNANVVRTTRLRSENEYEENNDAENDS